MELRDYLKVMRARVRLIVLSVIVVTLGTVAFSLVQKPAYQGVALVQVTQQDTGITMLGAPQAQQSYTPGRDEVQTQVEVIQSRRIAGMVLQRLGLSGSIDSLLSRVTVSADTGTNNIEIRVTDPSADGAAQIANAFADAYVTWSRDSQTSSIKTAADDVQRRLTAAQAQIVAIEATATARGASSADRVRLQSATTLYSTLADKLEQLRIAEQLATGTGSVLASATVDPVPVSPRPVRDGALGLAIGLLVGLMAAFLGEQLDTRIKTPAEAGEIYGAPVLASIPTEKVSKSELSRLTLTERPGSPAAEAYRMLRNNLGFVNFDKGIKTVLVTSAVPSEGKSTVAANLATVLSQTGSKVVLVICDFYLPAADRFFGLDYTVGLSDVLVGSHELLPSLQKPEGFDNLRVLTAGALPPNPSELLGSAAMGTLVADLRGWADWVIIDSAPVLATADAAAVTRWVDGVLVVARVGSSRRDAAHAGCEQLRNVGARILGLAVWGSIESVVTRGYYGYANQSKS
jgi:capsular exopolysaccharide synthesis family protein